MNCNLANKICIGTAQFGLNYGIANKSQKAVDKEETFRILRYAFEQGIDSLDTAYAYGESEILIGEFSRNSNMSFNIVSKFSRPDNFNSGTVAGSVTESLARLKQKKIRGYLIHSFKDFCDYPQIWESLKECKKSGYIEKIGFSLYNPSELDYLISRKIEFDIIQVPYSIFDRRFEKYFPKLKKLNISVYTRSVFLQGLAFLSPEDLKGNLEEAREILRKLHSFCLSRDIRVNALFLNFALANPDIDKVVIGVDSLKQLNDNLGNIERYEAVSKIIPLVDEFKITREEILLPYKWK